MVVPKPTAANGEATVKDWLVAANQVLHITYTGPASVRTRMQASVTRQANSLPWIANRADLNLCILRETPVHMAVLKMISGLANPSTGTNPCSPTNRDRDD